MRAAAALLPAPALAESSWPTRPIKIVCGYPAGGLTDIFARAYGAAIAQKTGQPVTVENKTGASGAIAAEVVKSAAPDGYTLMWTISTTMIMNKVLFKKLPYDPDKDFVPISWMDAGHLPLIVNGKLPIRNLAELAAYARTNKGETSGPMARVRTAMSPSRARCGWTSARARSRAAAAASPPRPACCSRATAGRSRCRPRCA